MAFQFALRGSLPLGIFLEMNVWTPWLNRLLPMVENANLKSHLRTSSLELYDI